MEISLRDQVALVTGGATGIGKTVAQQLLRCGARVIINDVNEDLLTETSDRLGQDVKTVVADVSQEADVINLVKQAQSYWDRLDIVVNNAAVTAPICPTLKQTLPDWQQVIDVNLRGTYLVSREAGRVLTKQRSGAIINVASLAGIASMPASNDYGVSKAGVVMMTRTLAGEWGRYGVRVNAVAPGFTEAPMLDRMLSTTSIKAEDYLRRIPMGRFAKAKEIAQLVSFLCSSMADYITGTVIPVDGGWSVNAGP